jgi:hypothetical protein
MLVSLGWWQAEDLTSSLAQGSQKATTDNLWLEGLSFLRLVLVDAALDDANDKNGDCAGDSARKTLGHGLFRWVRSLEVAASVDECSGECLEEIAAHAATDRTGDRMADGSNIMILCNGCNDVTAYNAEDDLNY